MFEIDLKVKFSEVSEDLKMNIEDIAEMFQECAVEHSESVGNGISNSHDKNAVWLTIGWNITVLRYPKMGERLKIVTDPKKLTSFVSFRDFSMTDEEGNAVAFAYSVWMYVDKVNKKFLKLDAEIRDRYEPSGGAIAPYYGDWRIDAPENAEKICALTPRISDTDANGHVNNISYIRYFSDFIAGGKRVKMLKVFYEKAFCIGESAELFSDGKKACLSCCGENRCIYEFEYF